MVEFNDKWYGWIPTNLGKVKFEFIDEEYLKKQFKTAKIQKVKEQLTISHADISYISDSPWFAKLFFWRKEYFSELDLTVKKKAEDFTGAMKILYKDSIEFFAEFFICSNGEVEFTLKQINNPESIEYVPFLESIKQIFYVVLKSIIHGDSHHHQKIDIAINITHDRFDEKKILDDMLFYLKTIEKNIKHIKNDSIRLKQSVLLDEVEGYLSYIETFVLLFEQKESSKLEKKKKIAQNIKKSLQATINKREKKHQSKEHFKTVLLTIAALFIATNILINSFYDSKEVLSIYVNNFSRNELFVYSFVFWFVVYFGFMYKSAKSFLYYNCYGCYKFLRNIIVALLGIVKIILIFLFLVIGIVLIGYGVFV